MDDIGQKIKGKAQQVKGEIQQHSDEGIKGGVTKLKGKFNETAADAKMEKDKRKDNKE